MLSTNQLSFYVSTSIHLNILAELSFQMVMRKVKYVVSQPVSWIF